MRGAIVAALVLAAAPAQAAVVTYYHSGTSIETCEVWDEEAYGGLCDGFQPEFGIFDGYLTIDESLLSSPLIDRTWSVSWGAVDEPGEHHALGHPFVGMSPDIGGYAYFRFDKDRNPIEWWIDVLAGPPDYVVGSGGSAIFGFGYGYYGAAGTLRLYAIDGVPVGPDATVIPLPAAGWMLLGGLAALGAAGWRRPRAA